MSPKRRLVALFDRRLVRRIILVPLVVLLAVLGLLLSPIIVGVALVTDIIAKRPRRPRARLAVMIIGALIIEVLGIVSSLLVWIVTGFGFAGSERWRWRLHRGFMGRYTNTMLKLITRVLGVSIEWRDHANLDRGPVVLLARHTSFFDALLPATVLSYRSQLLAHHVVTHGLRYAPCIDIVGHRFPNRFIKRTPGEGSSELAHIEHVGEILDDRSGAIIFPEGTFRNEQRFERQVRKLRRREPELAARAEQLKHVLPPRPNGTAALLAGTPGADVVICANTGFEPFGSIKQIVDAPYGDRPIIVETWRIARDQVPADPDAFHHWLFEQYVAIDEWVERNMSAG